MKVFEDFLDNIESEEILDKSDSNDYTETYDYIAYAGTSVDTLGDDPDEESEYYYS